MSRVLPSLVDFEPTDGKDYVSKVAAFAARDLVIAAQSSSAYRLNVKQTNGWRLIVPLSGRGLVHNEGTKFDSAPSHALLLPPAPREVVRTEGAELIIQIDSQRLELTRGAMAGEQEGGKVENSPHVIDLNALNRAKSLFSICNIIDSINADKVTGEVLGIDDLMYRWIALALRPVSSKEKRFVKLSKIDFVCDLIRSATERPLTLTEMEQFTGLSARSLQYAFQARFGCSPMQWQRNERLIAARDQLLREGSNASITSISYAFGFASPSAFASKYKEKFGESPTETLRR